MDLFSKWAPSQTIVKFWNTLTNGQKLVTTIFVGASVVLLGVVAVVATRPQMEILFSGLQPEDAGAIVAKLQERKTPYEMAAGGTAIKVPANDVCETRIELASAGLPHGGNIGFEIFDKTNLGMTEFDQRISYQRALQGELSRTINELDGVEASRVHIAIPERDMFDKEGKHPQASIGVKLRPGAQLGSDQVAGIVHLVSAAVDGMKPNYVTVVDTRGNVLWEASDSTNGMDPRLSATQMQLKQDYERQIQKNIESMIEQVVGANKAVVRVSAKMNFDRTETDKQMYEPSIETAPAPGTAPAPAPGTAPGTAPAQPVQRKGVPLSEERLEETYGGGSGVPGGVGGVAGISSNRGRKAVTITSAEEGGYKRTQTTTKYEVSKTQEHIVELPGKVEQISVAVMLDAGVKEAQIVAIRNSVETAAGIDLAKGDRVTVESVKFDNSAAREQDKEFKALAAKQTYLSVGKTVGGLLLIVGFLFFLKIMLQQVKIGLPQPGGREQQAPQAVSFEHSAAAQDMPNPVAVGAGVSPASGQHGPDEVAQVVREWISN